MRYRTEKDSHGSIRVPCDVYWGAQTQRSLQNFVIGNQKMPMEIIYAYALVKKACAMANADAGLLSAEKARVIARVCDEIRAGLLDNHFPLVVWQTGSGTQTNMNVNEVIANRAAVLKNKDINKGQRYLHPNDDVNKSQSSNDTFPTAMHIATYDMTQKKCLPALQFLRKSLAEKARNFRSIIKTGRTHGMDATPVTLGQEFSAFVSQLDHGIEKLKKSLVHVSELAIGATAVGTGINAPKNFDNMVVRYLRQFTGYPFRPANNKFEALAANDALVGLSAALKCLAVSVMKIGNDIRLLASGPRCGIGELILPSNEPGSSIMPGKVNPTQVEAITMICAQIMGNDTAITVGGMNGNFQLNVYKPLIIKNILESLQLLADGCTSFAKNCVAGIKANEQRIKQHLDRSLMLVTALNPHIGYDKAAEIAKKAHKDNCSLKEAAIKLNYLSARDFDKIVKPKNMV